MYHGLSVLLFFFSSFAFLFFYSIFIIGSGFSFLGFLVIFYCLFFINFYFSGFFHIFYVFLSTFLFFDLFLILNFSFIILYQYVNLCSILYIIYIDRSASANMACCERVDTSKGIIMFLLIYISIYVFII